MDSKRIFDSQTTITELMIPSYANFGGKVHGGILLSLMDKVAYVTATKHCSNYCVTVAVDGVEFLNPVEVGELISLKASVNYVGNTSLIVGIRVESLNPISGKVNHTNSCYFTMAAKDESGNLNECTICEDPKCADKYRLSQTNTADHSYYLGHFLDCGNSTSTY